ncbi:carboxypeptidase Q-like isoform X2 [Lineus longissimus]|uniref:carboxypeptidase Q-like isoform X2 n=1 Tax=Lineus longissimus TaxID=88925 RepID=UPI00315D612A
MIDDKMFFLLDCALLALFLLTSGCNCSPLLFRPHHLTSVVKEVQSNQETVDKIINLSLSGKAKSQSYNRLAEFTDTFGNRVAGSQNLENAIDYLLKNISEDGQENVHGEAVTVPKWVRGNEYAYLTSPRMYKMAILGLGSSIGTPAEGITAEAIVVNSFDELHQRAAEAKGKIVVYNEEYHGYGNTVNYRTLGAVEAAKVGGVASLIRSVTPFSINSPHTGHQDYSKDVRKIPTACITIEDAEMLARMQKRGTKIVIKFYMEAQNLPDAQSRNIVAEIVGSKYPEQVVLFGGHIDSWDVGQGAMDDGGGAFIAWQALSLIRQLGLRPKRTMRMVMFTGEEEGHFGGQAYFSAHKTDVNNYDLVMESDMGTFTPYGLTFDGSQKAKVIMQSVLDMLKRINATELKYVNNTGDNGDTGGWVNAGVPGVALLNRNENYFDFHHTNGDTITVQDPHMMDLCSAVWASVAYTVANLEEMLPRK